MYGRRTAGNGLPSALSASNFPLMSSAIACLVLSVIRYIRYVGNQENEDGTPYFLQNTMQLKYHATATDLDNISQGLSSKSSAHSFLAFLNSLASCAIAFTYFLSFGLSKVSALTYPSFGAFFSFTLVFTIFSCPSSSSTNTPFALPSFLFFKFRNPGGSFRPSLNLKNP